LLLKRIASRLRLAEKIINGYLPFGVLIWTYAKIISIITTAERLQVEFWGLQMTGFKKNFKLKDIPLTAQRRNFKYIIG
jgi:hypothetical protein